jgi:hypothetical protein
VGNAEKTLDCFVVNDPRNRQKDCSYQVKGTLFWRNVNHFAVLNYETFTRRKKLFDAIKFRTPEIRKIVSDVFRNAELTWVGKTLLSPAGSALHSSSSANTSQIISSNKVTPDERDRQRPHELSKTFESNIDQCSLSIARITPSIRNLMDTDSLLTTTLFNQLFHVLPLERKPFELCRAENYKCTKVFSKSNARKISTSFEYRNLLPWRNDEDRQNQNPPIAMKQNDVIENIAIDDNTVDDDASCVECDVNSSHTSIMGINDKVYIDNSICDSALSLSHGVMQSLLPMKALFPVPKQNKATFVFCGSKAILNNYVVSPQKSSIQLIFPILREAKGTFTLGPHLILNRVKSFRERASKVRKVETTLTSQINTSDSILVLIIYLLTAIIDRWMVISVIALVKVRLVVT